jgi:SAM-dependent methyltransferase
LITHNSLSPSSWVTRFVHQIPKGVPFAPRVLDYACGSGRHIQLLLEQGYAVLGVDHDQASLDLIKVPNSSKPFGLELRCIDLEQGAFGLPGTEQFAGVVVTNYLYRPFLDDLFKLVAKGGCFIYETFAVGNAEYGKPSNPDFLLRPNELMEAVLQQNDFQVLAFEHGKIDQPKPAIVQRICAIRVQESATIPR